MGELVAGYVLVQTLDQGHMGMYYKSDNFGTSFLSGIQQIEKVKDFNI